MAFYNILNFFPFITIFLQDLLSGWSWPAPCSYRKPCFVLVSFCDNCNNYILKLIYSGNFLFPLPIALGTSIAALYCSSLHERLSSRGGTTRMKTLSPSSKVFSFDRVAKRVAEPLEGDAWAQNLGKPQFLHSVQGKTAKQPFIEMGSKSREWDYKWLAPFCCGVRFSKLVALQMNSMLEYILLEHNLIYKGFKLGCSQGKAKAQTSKRLG